MDFNDKLCVGTELYVVVHAWKYVILLDFYDKLCTKIELHVVVHAWKYVIMLDFYDKPCAGTEMHMDVSCWIVLSIMNQRSLSNCVVDSESGVCYWIYVVRNESSFHCRIILSTTKKRFHCWILLYIVNQIFVVKFVLSATNQVFSSELCCPQRIKCLLPNCVVCSESGFRSWICIAHSESGVRCQSVLLATNHCSLLKVCCSQWICDSLLKLSCLWWISIRCRKFVGCNELVFAAKIMWSIVN